MDKQTYYVNFQTLEVSSLEAKKTHSLEIHATSLEKQELELTLEGMKTDDFMTFLRSVVPIKLYHEAEHNKHFMKSYEHALEKVYELGTDATKKFIEETGILSNKRIVKGESYPGREDNSE